MPRSTRVTTFCADPVWAVPKTPTVPNANYAPHEAGPASDRARTTQSGQAMITGSCRACGCAPIAFDARECRICGQREPNPGVVNRTVGPAMLYGFFAGAVIGGVIAYGSDGPVMAIGGAMLGSIPGVFFGVLIGLVLAVARRVLWGNYAAYRVSPQRSAKSCKTYPPDAARRHV